jgi:hypothetical protein
MGMNWQNMAKQAGQSLQQQGQQEDEMITKLAMMGPPPQAGGIQLQNNTADAYAEALKRAPVDDKTRGEASTLQGLQF